VLTTPDRCARDFDDKSAPALHDPTGAGTPDWEATPCLSRFTGKEHDTETGLDYFGARYNGSSMGRFMSPDPSSGTALHIISPQRWNMYAYALNSPLSYTDPDGRDAIAVAFKNLAFQLGHVGIGSVHQDGKGTFADFGPKHAGSMHDAGKYTFIDFTTQLAYGSDGKPTKESLKALANELADKEGQPRDSVVITYFKTSDAETNILDTYITFAKTQQADGKTPSYWGGFRDCIWFCQNGLAKIGLDQSSSILTVPNFHFLLYLLTADQSATGQSDQELLRLKSSHKSCLQTREGNCVD